MKLDKVNQIRRKLRMTTSEKAYFNKEEIQKIVAKVNPGFDFNSVPYAQVLSTTIPGWKQQQTIETHPTLENLEVIVNSLKSKKYSLKKLLRMIDQELQDSSRSITLKNKLLVIELK